MKRLPPAALVQKWLQVLAAAQRHVMQVPAARLGERATPGRDRSIRDLAYHVYQIPDAFLRAVEDGVEDLTSIYNAPPPSGVDSAEKIRAYGDAVSKHLALWWSALPDKSCKGPVKTYYGEQPLHHLLER